MGAVVDIMKPHAGLTQCQMVVRHVEENGGITAWEAINKYGITRLAARVHELNHTGYALKAEDIGDGYVRYVPDYRKRLSAIRAEIDFLVMDGTYQEIATKLPALVVEFNNAYRASLRGKGL